MLTTACKNLMLDAFGVTHLSLHTAYSSTGANEVSGGSPAYARKAASFSAAADESKALSATVTFDIPAATTCKYVGMWTALTGGTFLGMSALAGTELEFFCDLVNNKILLPGHTLVNGNTVVFYGGTPPGGLTEATEYFVVGSAADEFQVSATSGGAAIDLTAQAVGKCIVSKIVPEAFGGQGSLQITALTTSLTA